MLFCNEPLKKSYIIKSFSFSNLKHAPIILLKIAKTLRLAAIHRVFVIAKMFYRALNKRPQEHILLTKPTITLLIQSHTP